MLQQQLVDESWISTKKNENVYIGGSFFSDNINHVPQTSHSSSKGGPEPINMTSVGFVPNRIGMPLLEVFKAPMYKNAADVSQSAFIPTDFEMTTVKTTRLY